MGKQNVLDKMDQPENSHIKRVIAVISGKGGVGKSSIATLLASELRRRRYQVGLLDADITGPSIPKLMGVSGRPPTVGAQVVPAQSASGVRVISINLLLDNEEDPIIWRGPLLAGAVKQFWAEVLWGDTDYLVVDLPPGTGDVPLTVLQSLPLDGAVIVTMPQDLSVLVVKKAVTMVKMLNVPILGLVENLAWAECPECGHRMEPFGPSKVHEAAEAMGIDVLGSFPISPQLTALGDAGKIEYFRSDALSKMVDLITEKLPV